MIVAVVAAMSASANDRSMRLMSWKITETLLESARKSTFCDLPPPHTPDPR